MAAAFRAIEITRMPTATTTERYTRAQLVRVASRRIHAMSP